MALVAGLCGRREGDSGCGYPAVRRRRRRLHEGLCSVSYPFQAVGDSGHGARLGHGFPRQHGRQRFTAGRAGEFRCHSPGRAVGLWRLRPGAHCAVARRRLSGRPLRSPARLLPGRGALRSLVAVVRPRLKPGTTHRGQGDAGPGRRDDGTGLPGDPRRLFRGDTPGEGHRDLGSLERYGDGGGSGPWGLAGGEHLLAGGVPDKRASGHRHAPDRLPACTREPGARGRPVGLWGRSCGYGGSRGVGLRPDPLPERRPLGRFGARALGGWPSQPSSLRLRREQEQEGDDAALAFPLKGLRRRQPLHAPLLHGPDWILYFLPFLLIQVHGYSALVAGSVFLPFVAMAFVLGYLSGRIVTRFGVRLPLIVASLALAVGFLLFALPGANHHGSYWTSFFPAMVVQGFGMALVIAPLTTVALNSVEGPHSGLASGVNNAVCRAGGLVAVAVLGTVISAGFSAHRDTRMEAIEVSQEVKEAVAAEKVKLGAAEAPEGVSADTAVRIEEAMAESFVAGFRLVMVMGVGLALASALVALVISPQHATPARPWSSLHALMHRSS